MKRFFCFLFSLSLHAAGHGQVLRHEYLAYDFDTTRIGFDNPESLARAFFGELQTTRNLRPFFGTIEVFNYMIVHADMKHGQTVLKATAFYWQEFEAQRDQYCKQLLDNLDGLGQELADAQLEDIVYKVEQVNDSDVLATDIELVFRLGEDRYSILLDDCGKVRGKWFLMTPFVLWQGKVKDP